MPFHKEFMADATANSVESAFVEQAEYLDDALFSKWLVHHPKEDEILRKLKASGAKLLTGPRGTGKTTLMLRARNQLLHPLSDVLPAYVNFKTSLRLEPLYRQTANASFWFRQWLLLRTAAGVAETASQLGGNFAWSLLALPDAAVAQRAIDELQAGAVESAGNLIPEPLTVQALSEAVRRCISELGRSRSVLLFDDAAHAFSSEQQRDFFDFFREIKSSWISPKAAIYPGVTDFSASFHVGHDAEEIDIWLDPTDANYLQFMEKLLERRLSPELFRRFQADTDSFKVLALAAFGVPRNLLNMVRDVGDATPGTRNTRTLTVPRAAVQSAIGTCATNSLQVFKSLKKKLPVYSRFIDAGERLLTNGTSTLKTYNTVTTKAATATVAVQHPIPAEMRTLLNFLQYAGLIRPRGDLRRGTIGTFLLFDLHYALLIVENAVVARRSVGLSDLAQVLEKRDAHAFARITPSKLIGAQDIPAALPLMLPPCQVCHTERVSPTARFCTNCGASLTVSSTYETAVAQDLGVLPLTPARVKSIKAQSNIKSVKDVLLDKSHTELLRVRMVGPVWATRISRYAEEFVE